MRNQPPKGVWESAAGQAFGSRGRGATLAERYPSVEGIEFQLLFVEEGPTQGRTSTLSRRRKPRHSALFHFHCPGGCVGGGFDLNPSVHRMLRGGEHRTEGRLECRGWREARSREGSRCPFELRFVAWADYGSD